MYTLIAPFLLIVVSRITTKPSNSLIRTAYFLSLSAIYYYSLTCQRSPDVFKFWSYESTAILGIMLLVASDHTLIHHAEDIHKQQGQTRPFGQMSLSQRLWWSLNLFLTPRGINWSWEISHLRRSGRSRWTFVANRFLQFLFCVALGDTMMLVSRQNPAFQADSGEGFGSRGFGWQMWNITLWWLALIAHQLSGYSLLSAGSVALGLYEPKDWPSFYGEFRNTTTLRKFWGQTWHQLLRRCLQSHGKYVANDIFGFTPGTKTSSYTQLYTVFLISGLLHAGADYGASKSTAAPRTTLIFYILQALLITLEDVVIALGKALGVKRVPSLVSYLWVLLLMAWSGPFWIEGMTKAGITLFPPRFSVVKYWAE